MLLSNYSIVYMKAKSPNKQSILLLEKYKTKSNDRLITVKERNGNQMSASEEAKNLKGNLAVLLGSDGVRLAWEKT